MKNKYIILLSAFAFVVTGCKKLDLQPLSAKSVESFYQTKLQIQQAVTACYGQLQNSFVKNNYSYQLTEAASDNCFQGTEYDDGPVSRANVSSNLPVLYTAWSMSYTGIDRCNRILKSIPDIQMDDALTKQYSGEAKFMRALFYFDLVRFFGGVPIVTEPLSIPDSYNVPVSTPEQVYDLIVADLTDAAQLLPAAYGDGDIGRATSWAAKGYLGKVYLFRSGYPLKKNEWDKALAQFNDVINSGNFVFFPNYADIYSQLFETGKQSVFSIRFANTAVGEGNSFPSRNAPNSISKNDVPYGGSPYNLFVSSDLVESYEPGDLRKDVAIRFKWLKNTGDTIVNEPFSQKYLNGPINQNGWDVDWIALSYTDVLMMQAECLNEIGYVADGPAFATLNLVRQRAGLNPKTSADVPDQASFRLWMEEERRHEFCFENLRWFDLVRTDRALDVKKNFLTKYNFSANMKSRDQYIYPIPQRVINVSPVIKQNPGY